MFGKGVRRNTGNALGLEALRIETKNIRMGPDISRIVADEDGNVADDFYALASPVRVKCPPLLKERKLEKARAIEFFAQFIANRRDGPWLPVRELMGPGVPAPLLVAQA